MEKLLNWLEFLEDNRQGGKVKHKLKEIILIVLFATLANADDYVEISLFAKKHQKYLKRYIKLENGVPSHDTITRVMGMLSPEILQQLHNKWFEMMNEGKVLKQIIALDGKTMRGNKQNGSKPNHIVSAWNKDGGYCLGQQAVDEKSNEIKAIPELLGKINIIGQIVTIDAMGTQKEIAQKIKYKKADYILALKGNQGNLYEDVKLYFSDKEHLHIIIENGNYLVTKEKAHGQIETREYYQTDDIKWMASKAGWRGLKTIIMERKTINKNGEKTVIYRYFISSLPIDISTIARAVRGHWSVESMHWHLDVTFKEDANLTIDKFAARNHNIIRKWCLSILKVIDDLYDTPLSMKKKRFLTSLDPCFYLDIILNR